MSCLVCGASNDARARFCGMCGARLASHDTRRERRRVSVVFIDLAAFTTLTHGFDPEALRDLADEVLTVVAGVIEDYDGYVDAFRGDGLIALFGAPHSHPDDPQRAVLAAAAGLRAIESIGRSKGYPLRGRAGVNTGIVIAGAVGSGRVRDYTVMGSAVNLAARLEAAAEPGEVWVGPETYEATRHRLLFEVVDDVELAGFPNVRQAHRLASTLERHDLDPYARLRFVGRDRELDELSARLARVVATGRPAETFLVGEAGSGKTRLLREWTSRLPPDHVQVLRIETRPTEPWSWEPLARQLFGVAGDAEPRVMHEKVREGLERLLPGQERWHRYVLASLGLIKGRRWTRLERRTHDRVNVAWSDLLAAVPAGEGVPDGADADAPRPAALVVVVENDPHDPTLLEFLDLLRLKRAPILVLRAVRTRVRPGDDTIPLPPLSLDESLELLDQLASPLLRVASQSLVFQVGGVPAYVLELGRALSITQAGSFSGSLASLLQARLDMLPPRQRRLLAHASLAGERCWDGLLADLAGPAPAEGEGPEPGRDADVERLVAERLLVPEGSSSVPGQIEYRFQSELMRHAVMRMVPFAERPMAHLRIATWLESHAPIGLSRLIGRQFRDGRSPDAAYPHLLAAADLAAAQGDPETLDILDEMLALDLAPELRTEGLLSAVRACLEVGERERAAGYLAEARERLDAAPDEVRTDLEEAARRLAHDLSTLA